MKLQKGDWVIVNDPAGIQDPYDQTGKRRTYPMSWMESMDSFVGKLAEVRLTTVVNDGPSYYLQLLSIYGLEIPGYWFVDYHLEKVEKPSED